MSNQPAVPAAFLQQIQSITAKIADQPIDGDLQSWLAANFPADGTWFNDMEKLCHQGVEEGWLCGREHGGIKFGRPIDASPQTENFSVDVVEMANVVGPHHSHPNGEIDIIMPIDASACFDGAPRGWLVYPAGSAHKPTVRGGKAIILYLLPGGAIEFTRG